MSLTVKYSLLLGFRPARVTNSGHVGRAIDIPLPVGTLLYAPFSGRITRVRPDSKGAGGLGVWLKNTASGAEIRLWHLDSSLVSVGEIVRPGQPIAKSGNSGSRTTGPHLHLEYVLNGKFMDPLHFTK
jgi:murein DD-endopeptidase MepM/ murein hydrolase activator NlpD